MQQLIYYYVKQKCGCHCLVNDGKYSAHITLCGYDYYELADTAAMAIEKLATELSNNTHIIKNFKQ